MTQDAPTSKGQKTQAKILEQALKLFRKNGFANTSMQMIATACSLSQGAVMQHFPSKARLLEAVRKKVTQSNHNFVDTEIQLTDDSYVALRKHILLNLDWSLRYPAEANIIVLTYETAFHDPEYREVAEGAIRLGTERIYRYVLAAQREKLIPGSLNAEETSEILHDYLVGIIIRTSAAGKASRLNKALEKKIDIFLEQILTPAARR